VDAPVRPGAAPGTTWLEQEEDMADVMFVGLTLGFFALSWGLVVLCGRV
jgi:hypothetical protein